MKSRGGLKGVVMESSPVDSWPSYAANLRRQNGRHDVNDPDRMSQVAAGNGGGMSLAESRAKAARLARLEEAGGCLHTPMTAGELETHLVRAITARTSGRVQGLRVQIQGGRTVLSGFSESYHAIQLAVAGLLETLDALGLDHPGRVDLNIDVLPYRPG